MHFVVYALLKKDNLSKNQAREIISMAFARKCKYYYDWYQMGGRWSGYLKYYALDRKRRLSFEKEVKVIEKKTKQFSLDEKEYIKLFNKYFQKERMLWKLQGEDFLSPKRDGYTFLPDDIQIVTKELFDNWLKHYDYKLIDQGGAVILFKKAGRGCSIVEFEEEKPTEDLIGNYYISIIDYHM